MKHTVLVMFLLVSATPVFANDDGGDGAYIPSYRELVREGYGPRDQGQVFLPGRPIMSAPKPTMAYYGKGYTIYYGYTVVPRQTWDPATLYAFGYPLEYFHHMMPASVDETNLANYAVSISTRSGPYGPADAIARANADHSNAVTAVRATTNNTTSNTATAGASGANALPAIGEKPPH